MTPAGWEAPKLVKLVTARSNGMACAFSIVVEKERADRWTWTVSNQNRTEWRDAFGYESTQETACEIAEAVVALFGMDFPKPKAAT